VQDVILLQLTLMNVFSLSKCIEMKHGKWTCGDLCVLLENVPLVGDFPLAMLVRWQHVQA
jgi:hypothetical protein